MIVLVFTAGRMIMIEVNLHIIIYIIQGWYYTYYIPLYRYDKLPFSDIIPYRKNSNRREMC